MGNGHPGLVRRKAGEPSFARGRACPVRRKSEQDMMRRSTILLAVLAILLVGPAGVRADAIDDLVAQVGQTTYQGYLQGSLFTSDGDDRGFETSGTDRYPRADHDPARDNVLAHFTALGLSATLDPFTFSTGGANYLGCNNVVGVLTGTVRPNDIYIVGAHYDSVNNPGADDNASGVAGVMEAARVLSQYEFEATILFAAFDAEEKGLYGSAHYAGAHSGDSILGMISLDMIAYNPASNHDKAYVYGKTASDPIKQDLADALAAYTGITPTIGGDMPGSDHAPFEDEGFDACLLIEYNWSPNPNYHRSTDSIDTPGYLDYAFATEMTRGAVGYLATAAGLVPEPATLALLGAGALALLVRRQRRT
jgi:hypothetical protein